MTLHGILSRADESLFEELLGSETTRVLALLDTGLTTAASLRRLVSMRHPPPLLLRDTRKRKLLFDLLSDSEANDLVFELTGKDSDAPHAELNRMTFHKGSAKEAMLFEQFGLTVPEPEDTEQTPSQYSVCPAYSLFPHQRAVAGRALRALTVGPGRALIHMPTGSGKTRTAMHVIADFLRVYEQGVVVWLAHSEELCAQAAEELQAAWKSIGNREIKVSRFWGKHSIDPKDLVDGVVVASVGKMDALAMKDLGALGRIAFQTNLVVIDEGHKATAPTYKSLLRALLGPSEKAGLLGLTATPGRSWLDISADEELAEVFKHQRIPLEIEGYDNPVDYLVDEGYLARPQFRSLHASGSFELSNKDMELLEKTFDIPERILHRLAEDEKRTLVIVRAIEELVRRHTRVLVFATTVSHAHLLSTVLSARGTHSFAVTTYTSRYDRAEALRAYKQPSNEPLVLCNFGVLTTGFDAPVTSAGVIARPTNSLVLYSQMIGRMMRGPLAGGNEHCEILTVVDQTLPGFQDMADAFAFWNDVWGGEED